MRMLPAALFLRDRLIYVLSGFLIISTGVCLMLLENARYPGLIDTSSIYYFVTVAAFFLILGLAIDYIRQHEYYKQLRNAIERSDELHVEAIVLSAVTREQKLIARLLDQQMSVYLSKLGIYRRQQELHNHFVLQWVHHMKTPLSVIDLLLQETAKEMPSSEKELKELSLSLHEESDRMSRGLEMLLNTARLEKFEMDLHLKKTSLHHVIRDVLIAHKRLCIRHNVIPQIHGELWTETDEKWMTVVLNQIVSNAIKYCKNKKGVKNLIFHLEQNTDTSSKLSITDEGRGIAPHDIPRIFDPFFTGENGRSAGDSTGMGLYLAKQVCSKLGHELSVSSEFGIGTTFTITFQSHGIHFLGCKAGKEMNHL
ncbi:MULTISPECIES: sensor histidine kinase [Bacillus cereus group]|uniref:sensor histidine kinase n=1 Tax=Bacillus cereus group TaxID=86661 RepID=UPI000BEC1A6D|nr:MULTISPECIES: sensor histidine kinase [Bacillus cereus group]PEB95465.1 two-component sensor histidine kinase [Bacillus cereus]PEC24098.1 two-component sensor histidine kinase [Bacillus thuringiensis]PEC76630.1 two-component sensor histidine kinase [Bacillus cereus]PEQ69966.1 two-component sensor histidine kinase [Bacillus cereus]PFR33285.1 two-component sensor histidine kinase [Bacillus cereus]